MAQPDLAHLTYDLRDHVAVVTLNRPEVRNALNARAYADLETVFRHIQSDNDAREAERIGLVSKVVPHGELMDAAFGMAARIAANAPLALRYMREGLRRASARDVHEFGSWVSGALGRLFQTEDHREGVASFLEKRAPQFKGR